MTTWEQAAQAAPVSHEHDDRFDRAPDGAAVRFPRHERSARTVADREQGDILSEFDLRDRALEILRTRNKRLNGKRGAGHVGLSEFRIALTVTDQGNSVVRLVAIGFRHKTAERLEATCTL